jgi:hypothetical protein
MSYTNPATLGGTFTGGAIVNTIYPTTTDTAALGSTSHMWSDLFLANGGVINFNNGNVRLLHSTGTLTLEGIMVADGFKVNQTATEQYNRLYQASGTSAYYTDIKPSASALAGNTTVRLPAADGLVLATLTGTETLTNKTLTDPAVVYTTAGLTSDHSYNGRVFYIKAGEALAFGDLVCAATTTGAEITYKKCVNTNTSTMPNPVIYVVVAATISSGSTGLALREGYIRDDSNFSNISCGKVVYATATGSATATVPGTSGNVVQVVGTSRNLGVSTYTQKILDFRPQLTMSTVK